MLPYVRPLLTASGSALCFGLGIAAFWLAHIESVIAAAGVFVILYMGPLLVLFPLASRFGLAGREATVCSMLTGLSFAALWSAFVVIPADNPAWVPWLTLVVVLGVVGIPSAILAQIAIVFFPKRTATA